MQETTISLKLQQQPQSDKPSFDAGLNIWFLLDKVRGEKTLPTFYQGSNSGLIAGIDYLLMGTEHADLLEASPLLIKLNHTQLSDTLYQHIQQERSGIFIQAKDDNILPHLQYLFIMQSEEQGQVYARYYDPLFWTALQLSLEDQQQAIWGNLQKVYALAPDSREDQLNFISWVTPKQEVNKIYSKPQQPIQLTAEFEEVSEDIRLLYFIYQTAYQQAITLTNNPLSTLINLKILIGHQIYRADQLQQLLLYCVAQNNFTLRPDIQEILKSNLSAYEKVVEIRAIA